MNKDKDVRMSRWNAWKLTAEQKMYAAVDVYVSLLPPFNPFLQIKKSSFNHRQDNSFTRN